MADPARLVRTPEPGRVKRYAPATARNQAAIAAVLVDELPDSGLVLEVASGSGQHAAAFAAAFPSLVWQPSDADPDALASIEAWGADAELPNLRDPILLDAAGIWPIDHADVILCVNMVHISSWAATAGLMRGAGRLLSSRAPLILYGPYRRSGIETAPSNEAFDQSLKARNPDWGLRSVEQVQAEAAANGLGLRRIVEMPANNLTLVFRKD